jgi:hypothetical protein
MSDKIKTIPILLFIVVLVILYLIVNRKTQVREGFDAEEQEKANFLYQEVKNTLFNSTDVSGYTFKNGYRKPSNSGRRCYTDREGYTEKKTEMETIIKTRLQALDDELKNDIAKTFVEEKNRLIKAISSKIYKDGNNTVENIISTTSFPSNRGTDTLPDSATTPWYKGTVSTSRLNCEVFTAIKDITYNDKLCNDDNEFFNAIDRAWDTSTEGIKFKEGVEEAVKEAAEAKLKAVEVVAKRSKGATEAKNALVKSKIEAYINFLKENDFFGSVVIDNIMNNSPPAKLSTLETDLFDKMFDYYKKNITNKAYNIETSCSTPSINYNKTRCKEIGNIYGDYYLNENIQT